MKIAFILKYKDKDESINKEIRFLDRHSANLYAEKIEQYGHSDVIVEDRFKGNYVGAAIKIIGIIEIIAGIILGIILGRFNFSVALYWWISSIVIGVLLIGFAEIINLLDAIKKKIKA